MSSHKQILRLDASANSGDSSSRQLGDYLVTQLEQHNPGVQILQRDLNRELSFIDDQWIAANFTDSAARTTTQSERLVLSDQLIDELKWADHIVLTTPMYNFGVPATLKAWIDLVCRAGITFRYGANGPEGLLTGKTMEIIITTGGVPLASPVDFVSGYLKQVFGFIGIEDVKFVGADQMNVDSEASFNRAKSLIAQNFSVVQEVA